MRRSHDDSDEEDSDVELDNEPIPPRPFSHLLVRGVPVIAQPTSSDTSVVLGDLSQPSASHLRIPASEVSLSADAISAQQHDTFEQPEEGSGTLAPVKASRTRPENSSHSLPTSRQMLNSKETLSRLQGYSGNPPVSSVEQSFVVKMPTAGSSNSKFTRCSFRFALIITFIRSIPYSCLDSACTSCPFQEVQFSYRKVTC